MNKLIHFFGLMLIWLLLTWSLDPQPLLFGAASAILIAFGLNSLYQDKIIKIFNPVRWLWFVVFFFYFLYYCFGANLDVAYRALHPNIPIKPGIVKVRTTLKTALAKTFLANSITLTPGTLTVDIKDDRLFIHWINIASDDPEQQTDIVVKRFERILRRIFE